MKFKVNYVYNDKPFFTSEVSIKGEPMCNCNQSYHACNCRRYGFFNFLWDVIMVTVTCGFWLVWIFVREMRK